MALEWPKIQDAIKCWFKESTGLPVFWAEEPRGYHQKVSFVELNIITFGAVAPDEIGYTNDPGAPAGEGMIPTLRGFRRFTVSANAMGRNQKPGQHAWTHLENARAQGWMPFRQQQLKEAGLAIIRMLPTQNISAVFANRQESRANMDIQLSTAVNLKDIKHPTAYIDRCLFSTDLQDANGDSLPAECQAVDVEI